MTKTAEGQIDAMRGQPFILVTGGCRSGKSRYAQKLVEFLRPGGLYLATAEAFDREMQKRIDKHRQERGKNWFALEPGIKNLPSLAGRVGGLDVNGRGLLFDCLTLWCSGMMESGLDEASILTALDGLLDSLSRLPCPVVMVTNELGSGLVPESSLARTFRDLAGAANQKAAARADIVVLMVCGIPVAIKGKLPTDMLHS